MLKKNSHKSAIEDAIINKLKVICNCDTKFNK